MARVLLTKNELKKQRDSLKLFSRYLPTLQLKKQQLQTVLRRISEELDKKREDLEQKLAQAGEWVAVLGEKTPFEEYISVKEVNVGSSSMAGVDVPVFRSVTYNNISYDLFTTPLWVDTVLRAVKELKAQIIEVNIIKRQHEVLVEELKVTTQRVNFFEKVKIPQAKELIRKIQIVLADQQTAAVVRGKISKRKMTEHVV